MKRLILSFFMIFIGQAAGFTIVERYTPKGLPDNGTVSCMDPDYWYRGFFRCKFGSAQSAVKAAQARLVQALY
ncbi:MAG: hypothetical protein KGN32_03255 [Burkholderiales bacterium]|nr:hypothetical protein [Burkholderiales bacterium]